MTDVQCYELFGGIALKIHTFSFSFSNIHFTYAFSFVSYMFCSVVFQSSNSIFQQTNSDPYDLSIQLLMHHESLMEDIKTKIKHLKILKIHVSSYVARSNK